MTIANSGVNVNGTPGQSLLGGVLYLVALYNNAGVLTPIFYAASLLATPTHIPDTTTGNVGVEVINGNPGATLIGMVFTNGIGQFTDAPTARYVASWFNRRRRYCSLSIANCSTTNTSYVALSGGIAFVAWGGEAVQVIFNSFVTNTVAGNYGVTQVRDDQGVVIIAVTNFGDNVANSGSWIDQGYEPNEGQRSLTLWGLSQQAANTYSMSNNVMSGNLII